MGDAAIHFKSCCDNLGLRRQLLFTIAAQIPSGTVSFPLRGLAMARRSAFLLALLALPTAASAQVQLEWPVACKLGETCAIQHYVDRDPGPQAKDYQCGTVTYDAHNGTDIRLRTTSGANTSVDVLAAASGRVVRTRDEMRDVSVREVGKASIAGRECGNGLVIDHGEGWTTQYCHMAQGSIRVQPGQSVSAGQPLGKIGLSGDTEFPHLHFTVRLNRQVVDPFAYRAAADSCGGGESLWTQQVRSAHSYHAGEVLNAGFASGPVTGPDIDNGAGEKPPTRDAASLIAFVRAIGLQKGDVQRLTVTGPNGEKLAETTRQPLDNNKAQYILYVGKKKGASEWPAGEYVATYSVTREGRAALEKTFKIRL
jgi:hypothetical protein